jgi:hypothetical protein
MPLVADLRKTASMIGMLVGDQDGVKPLGRDVRGFHSPE